MPKFLLEISGLLLLQFYGLMLWAQPNGTFLKTEKPIIQHYTFNQYGASTQNWAVVQDSAGVMYFGNNAGLLRFDGNNWDLYKLKNKSMVRSLALLGDKLFVGGIGEFGYFTLSPIGATYTILSDTLTNINADVWQIFEVQNKIYFVVGTQMIFVWENGSIRSINIPNNATIFKSFKCNNDLYFATETSGIAKLKGDSIELLHTAKEIWNEKIFSILPFDNNSLILATSQNGLYLIDTKSPAKLMKLNTNADYFFSQKLIYSGLKLPDNMFAFSSLNGGLIIISNKGEKLYELNSSNGLMVNAVYDMFIDKENTLWLATEHGLYKVFLQLPVRKFGKEDGLNHIISNLHYFNHLLYIGTHSSTYAMPVKNISGKILNEKLEVINEEVIYNQGFAELNVNSDDGIKKILLGAYLRGIYAIYGTKLELLEAIYSPTSLKQSSKQPDILYAGSINGIFVYKLNYRNNRLSIDSIGKLKTPNSEVRNIVEDAQGYIWFGADRDGVYRVKFKDMPQNEALEFNRFGAESGLPSHNLFYPVYFNNQLFVLTNGSVFKFVKDNTEIGGRFELAHEFNRTINGTKLHIKELKTDSYGRIWIIAESGYYIGYYDSKKIFQIEEQYTAGYIPNTDANIFTVISENEICVGDYDKILRINGKFKELTIKKLPKVVFSKVSFGNFVHNEKGENESIELQHLGGSNWYIKQKLPYFNTKVKIEFGLPSYEPSSMPYFEYKLEGIDLNWNMGNAQNIVVYNTLPEGNYTFKVRARSLNGIVSDETTLKFTIAPPYFRSFAAYIVYFILLIVLFLLGQKWYQLRYIAKKAELEKVIQERTAEIMLQKQEIEHQAAKLHSQAEMLKLSVIELRQFSMVTKGADSSVVILNEKGDFEWWNEGFMRLFKHKFKDFKGSNFNKIKHLVRPDLENNIRKFDFNVKSLNYITHEKNDNQDFWYQTNITPIFNDDGTIFRWIAVDTDISNIKMAEQEIMRKNAEIEAQRDQIFKQNKEMRDSIHYAARIQQAMLPLNLLFEALFDDFFILNRPRDIVSGDFYWASHKNDYTFVAVADCTGHGIPGAFLSLLGMAYLNDLIQRLEVMNPAELLNQLRERFILALHQRGKDGETRDGLDISMISIHKASGTIQFAGANNAAYILRHADGELIKLKPDKMPIGFYSQDLPAVFTTKELKYSTGDSLYLLTDGYRDQFGGPLGKKFLTKRLEILLRTLKDTPMSKQQYIFENELDDWMKGMHQIDDILVVGITF